MQRVGAGIFKVLTSCAVAGLAVIGCGEIRNAAAPSPAAPLSLTNSAPRRTEASERLDAAHVPGTAEVSIGPELAAVRRATAAFHRVEEAMSAGYLVEEACVESPAGAMGMHAPNRRLIGDQAVDPERPEALLYLPAPAGGVRLVGVEYLQVVLLRNTVTGQVAPWVSSTPWPSTYHVVTPTPELFGQRFDGPMPGHHASMPWHWDLHVWIWAANPSGVFAQWNPALRCAA